MNFPDNQINPVVIHRAVLSSESTIVPRHCTSPMITILGITIKETECKIEGCERKRFSNTLWSILSHLLST